jgi:hypothetical protein
VNLTMLFPQLHVDAFDRFGIGFVNDLSKNRRQIIGTCGRIVLRYSAAGAAPHNLPRLHAAPTLCSTLMPVNSASFPCRSGDEMVSALLLFESWPAISKSGSTRRPLKTPLAGFARSGRLGNTLKLRARSFCQ